MLTLSCLKKVSLDFFSPFSWNCSFSISTPSLPGCSCLPFLNIFYLCTVHTHLALHHILQYLVTLLHFTHGGCYCMSASVSALGQTLLTVRKTCERKNMCMGPSVKVGGVPQ